MVQKRWENSEQKASRVVKSEHVLFTLFYSLGHNYIYVSVFTRQTMPVKNNVAHSTQITHLCMRRNSEIPPTSSPY